MIKIREGQSQRRDGRLATNQDQLEGEDLIDFLEVKLEEIEKKLAYSQGDYEELQNDCLEI